MDNEWEELKTAELARRSDAVMQFCTEQGYSTGQTVRALLISSEVVLRSSMKYDLPEDNDQKAMIKEMGDLLIPLFKKHGMAIISLLIFLIGNFVSSSVDITTPKPEGKGYE